MKLLCKESGVTYELFEMSALDNMATVIADAFINYEPMTIAQCLSREEFIDFIRLLGLKAAQEALTVIARDQATGQIIGAALTDDFASAPTEGIEHVSEKFAPIFALLDTLDDQYKQDRRLQSGKYLHIFMIAVIHPYTGQKVAQNLVKVCLANGITKGYKFAVTEATGVVSQHIFRKLGFRDCIESSYKTFTYEGRHVFASIERHASTILMNKILV